MNLLRIEETRQIPPELAETIETELERYAMEKMGFDGAIAPYSYIAYSGESLAGVIECKTFWGTLYIRRLLILPRFRKQGIGKELVQTALAHAKTLDCRCALVETMHFQALQFYEKFGFYVEFSRKCFSHDATLYYLRKDF